MPMFDDPKKELQRLQQQLLAEEEKYEEEYLTEEEWFEREIAEAKVLSGYQEPEVRNYANGYGAQSQANRQNRPAYQPHVPNAYEQPIREEPEEKGVGGLIGLAVALTMGIVAVAAYWVLVLL